MSELSSKIEDEIIAILEKEKWPPLEQDEASRDDDLLSPLAIVAIFCVLLIAIGLICAIIWRIVL